MKDCARCHTTSRFKPSTFRHSSVFKLAGAHNDLRCSSCHPSNRYASRNGTTCSSCHGSKHGGLKDCADCHTTNTFEPSTFNHDSRFELVGAHDDLRCSSCHPDNAYARRIGSGTTCAGCHGSKHGGLTDCTSCHTVETFSPAKDIDHPGSTPLGGEHRSRACSLCHEGNNFTSAPRACVECHTAPHVRPTDCLRCHEPTQWSNVDFEHSWMWYHADVGMDEQCGQCHTTNDYGEYSCSELGCHDPGAVSP